MGYRSSSLRRSFPLPQRSSLVRSGLSYHCPCALLRARRREDQTLKYRREVQVVCRVKINAAGILTAVRILAAVRRGLYRAQRDVADSALNVDVLRVEDGIDQGGIGVFSGNARLVILALTGPERACSACRWPAQPSYMIFSTLVDQPSPPFYFFTASH